MEIVILTLAALVAALYLEAAYWLMRFLISWLPALVIMGLAAVVAHRVGFDTGAAAAAAAGVCLVARSIAAKTRF